MNSVFTNTSKKITVFAFGFWWTSWFVAQAIILHRLQIEWKIAFIDSFIFNALLATASIAATWLFRYYQPGNSNRLFRFVFAVVISILLCDVMKWTLECVFQSNSEYLVFLDKSMPLRFAFTFIMLAFVAVLNWMWNTLNEQSKEIERRNSSQQMLKEAELAKLRQQIQPHFLFNSLNSISALAASNPIQARKMIQQLSDFLRGTIKKDEQQLVTLKEEIELLNLYLEIEKVRFGDRLNTETQIDETLNTSLIPPLLLQPIVENAIKFGLYGTIDDVTIWITVSRNEKDLIIEIKNPFDSETTFKNNGTGFGLSSIQRRLYLLYSRNDLLQAKSVGNEFITTLKIPITK